MSVTVSTSAQICNSPLNHSTAKNLWSFPKSSRFLLKNGSNCEQAFYDLPPVRMKRTAGFGYGTKYDFTHGNKNTPAPNVYTIKPEIEANPRKGLSFGLGRDAIQQGGILQTNNKKNPGPGAYDVRSSLSNISFSIRPRTKLLTEQATFLKVPGPGAYPNLPSITNSGKYFFSKYKDSGATTFSPARSSRFSSVGSKALAPGPGHYNPNVLMTSDGKYFVSNFKSSGCRSFSHSIRKAETSGFTAEKTPGPGTYRLPSEFGYYESARVHAMSQSQGNLETKKGSPAK